VDVAEESSVDEDREELADRHDHARRERSLRVIVRKGQFAQVETEEEGEGARRTRWC
jgi:hypothetical protein